MKKILAISLALSMVLAIASCGGDDTATSSTASTAGTSSTAATSSTVEVSSAAPVVSTPSVEVTSSEVSTEPTETNLALNGEAVSEDLDKGAYNDNGTEFTADRVLDGDITTGWQINYTLGEGETHDFGDEPIAIGATWEEAATITSVKVLFENGSRPAEDGYKVEYTTDGEEWTEIEDAEITAATADGVYDEVTFEAIEEATGARVVIYKTTSKWAPKVFEVEVYGAAAAEDAEGEAETETEAETEAEAE